MLAALDQLHKVQGLHPSPFKSSTNTVIVPRKIGTSTQNTYINFLDYWTMHSQCHNSQL